MTKIKMVQSRFNKGYMGAEFDSMFFKTVSKLQYFSNFYSSRLIYLSKPSNALNTCVLTGRSRGMLRSFKLSSHSLKKLGSGNLMVGLKKSSW